MKSTTGIHRFMTLCVVAFAAAFLDISSRRTLAQQEPTSAAIARPTWDQPRLYEGLGNYHRSITANSSEAQKWFDQGLHPPPPP